MPGQPADFAGLWYALDERERACLAAVYAADRAEGRAARAAARRGGRRPPVDPWCWLPCAPDWPLYTRLARAGLLDAGTEATFATLERRGLVARRYDETTLGTTLLVRLTRVGRTAARGGAGA